MQLSQTLTLMLDRPYREDYKNESPLANGTESSNFELYSLTAQVYVRRRP